MTHDRSTPDGIAVVGLGCRFPDANSPQELWELVLSGRRAFRRMPAERLRLEDYSGTGPDSTYLTHAAVLRGFEFDRVGHKVAGSTYRATDMAHWLALDTAARALEDAGFSEGDGLPSSRVSVIIGNTLTGEFSRAENLRLRFPYVLRSVDAVLQNEGRSTEERREFLEKLEAVYKAPFHTPGEESLAGGLANTIAGRICNYFDFGSGGYTVDGACSSSLLAISTACANLQSGDADVVLAGGVDLSLDPFELVGFARTGALSRELMRVFDKRPTGFLPGEGCGFVVLMREEEAIERGLRIYSTVRGWGISSDGAGGMTRPTPDGERRAIDRAYQRAGFGVESVRYFEGHGTGTAVGDAIELATLSQARRDGDPDVTPARIGSIKANFGHTKAAAGIAAFIKATLTLHHQVIPPTVGCREPHEELTRADAALDVGLDGQPWPEDAPLRAGVTSMGFGGINVHVVLDGDGNRRAHGLDHRTRRLLASPQDAELIVFSAQDRDELSEKLDRVRAKAAQMSLAELGDLAVSSARELDANAPVRAALVVSDGDELEAGLARLNQALLEQTVDLGESPLIDTRRGVFLAESQKARVGFLFPGQGSPANLGGGALARRYPEVAALFGASGSSGSSGSSGAEDRSSATEIAQPAIVGASLAAATLLAKCGVDAVAACGHSLGELSALGWAGAFDFDDARAIAGDRGAAMALHGSDSAEQRGGMLALSTDIESARKLVDATAAAVAGDNGPKRTVVSGPLGAIEQVSERARQANVSATPLRVSHGFHSSCVAHSRQPFQAALSGYAIKPPTRTVVSTVTGDRLNSTTDVRALLDAQIVEPVRFREAVSKLADGVDLLLEVGPGTTLTQLSASQVSVPVLATDAGGDSLRGWLSALGALHVLGAAPKIAAVLTDRFARPFSIDRPWKFLSNPCEQAPTADVAFESLSAGTAEQSVVPSSPVAVASLDPLRVLTELVAAKSELPVDSIASESHFLDDLHLNSIAVGSIVVEACERLGLPAPIAPNEFAGATIAAAAQVLTQMRASGSTPGAEGAVPLAEESFPEGVERWVRCFEVRDVAVSSPSVESVTRKGEAVTEWRAFSSAGALAEPLARALEEAGLSSGVLLLDDSGQTERSITRILDAARTAHEREVHRFVLVSFGEREGAAPLVRTLHQERPGLQTTIVHWRRPVAELSEFLPCVLEHVRATERFREVTIEPSRTVTPVLEPIVVESAGAALDIDPTDCWIVTGGGKGIAAECAFALARDTGCRLVLMGRADPASDDELAENLARFSDAGLDAVYLRADVTDRDAVMAAVDQVVAERPITGFLHGAGLNEPRTIRELDGDGVERTAAPKLVGFDAVLSALEKHGCALRHVVTFGSIIARTGLEGEADYALANAWLRERTDAYAAGHPQCRALCLEWSVWSGVGMGERLGRIEALRRDGIEAITPEQGVGVFLDLLRAQKGGAVVITGRLGERATLGFRPVELPILRFLEQPRVHVPGVELVVDAELSESTDPYLADHVMGGDTIVPGVIGLEAMTQVATGLLGSELLGSELLGSGRLTFTDVEFRRPIVVPPYRSLRVRVAAIVDAADTSRARIVVRSESTGFAIDHFSANVAIATALPADDLSRDTIEAQPLPLSCDSLYGDLLFQSGRFQRLESYVVLEARRCVARLALATAGPSGDGDWFRGYHAATLVAGDPGARDAALHAIQACVPDGVLLPTAVGRWTRVAGVAVFARAEEVHRDGDTFTYRLTLHDGAGQVIEEWHDLKLVRVEGTQRERWAPALMAPQLERHVGDLAEAPDLRVVVDNDTGHDADATTAREARSRRVFVRLSGGDRPIRRRPDGKRVASDGDYYSASHSEETTLGVKCSREVACDLERVTARSRNEWKRLLADRWRCVEAIAAELGSAGDDDTLDVAATRVWGVIECLKKSGLPVDSPLILLDGHDGWVRLQSGEVSIVSWSADLGAGTDPIVATILLHPARAGRPDESVRHANL